MHSLTQEYLMNLSVPLTMMSNSLRALGRYQGIQELLLLQRPELIKTLKEIAIVQSSESSNRIEGINVPHERLEKIIKGASKPQNRPEAQVLGYRDVLAKIHTSCNTIDVTPKAILGMHKDMLKYTDLIGGEWKAKDNMIEERLTNGEWVTRFVPVSAADTPYYMETLCKEFRRLWNQDDIDRLILIFAFIFDFLCIHPFADGNGRLSRLLTVLLLHQLDIDVVRYISYERLIENTKESYYDILHKTSENWDSRTHRLLPWIEYNIGLLIAAYKELEERVSIIDYERGAKTALIIESIHHLPSEFGIGDLIRLCPGISRPMIRHVLESQRKKGLLESVGVGRSAKWRKLNNEGHDE